jgi:hypothetical protein
MPPVRPNTPQLPVERHLVVRQQAVLAAQHHQPVVMERAWPVGGAVMLTPGDMKEGTLHYSHRRPCMILRCPADRHGLN